MSLTLLGGGSTCPAYLVSAVVQSSGTTLRLTFSANVSVPGEPTFTVTGFTGGAVTVPNYNVGGAVPANAIDLSLGRTVVHTETGGLTAYSGGGIRTVSNALIVPPYSAISVTNSSTQ